MDHEYPPFVLNAPEIADRKKGKGRLVPLPPEIAARRALIARSLLEKIGPISDRLSQLSDAQRRAVFVKLEHEVPINLSGTDLKPIIEPSETVTLAVPRSTNLGNLTNKISEFGTGALKKGQVPNGKLGSALKEIVFGSPKDRLSEEILNNYDHLISQPLVICEIEILTLEVGKRKQSEDLANIRQQIKSLFGISNGTFFENEELKNTCRAVIRCTGAIFKELVEGDRWQTKIFWFDAKPKFQTYSQIIRDFNVSNLGPITPPDATSSTVCIVDSGVTAGNPFLQPVVKKDLCHSFLRAKPDSPYDEVGHGSSVASLVSFYAIDPSDGASNFGRSWIASARILNENNEIEDDRLFSLVLREVVETFYPLGTRIFNLSVNVAGKKWNEENRRTIPRKSWVSRAIDRLSKEFDIVFVVSSGNIAQQDVRHFLENGKPYPEYLIEDDSRILDPAQSALAITVGALSFGKLIAGPDVELLAIAEKNLPSPFTRSGPGIKGEIKPELVDFGGNYLLDPNTGSVRINIGTSVPVATSSLTPALTTSLGTSLAAARVSHKLAQVLQDLSLLGLENVSANLLKAFLVNSATYREEGDEISEFKQRFGDRNRSWLNLLGYGMPDASRATTCDNHTVILFYQGEMQSDKVAFFDIPIPASLAQTGRSKKILSITVSFSPEIQRTGLEQYFSSNLKWRVFRGDVSREEIISLMSADLEESEELEDTGAESEPENATELKGRLGINVRSKGAIQHDDFEWNLHRSEYSDNHYTLAVSATEKWNSDQNIELGIVVRLVDESQAAMVYNQVLSTYVRTQIQARSR